MKSSLALLLISQVACHSWIDCISQPEKVYTSFEQHFSNDFYKEVCSGYPRNYPGRENKEIGRLYTVTIEREGYFPIGATPNTTKACVTAKTQVQLKPHYPDYFPMTKAKAGSSLKLWYELDGHNTRPSTYNLYASSEPEVLIETYEQMKNSQLILVAPFVNENICSNVKNNNSLCWGTFQVPQVKIPGRYSFVWNWPWNQNPEGDAYNTCFEIDITV